MMKECRGLWAVVPVKSFDRTKRRLMPLLSPHEREALAQAMLEDVLLALACSPSLAGILVITGDAEAAAIARAANASVLADDETAGTAAAVATAAHRLAAAEREGMLVVPSDVPLITPLDIETCTRGALRCSCGHPGARQQRRRDERARVFPARCRAALFRRRQLSSSPGGGARPRHQATHPGVGASWTGYRSARRPGRLPQQPIVDAYLRLPDEKWRCRAAVARASGSIQPVARAADLAVTGTDAHR